MLEKGHYVLVTGASSGVGREIAVFLSKEYNLILNGRDVERLEETKSRCFQESDVLTWPFDLSDSDGVEKAIIEWIGRQEHEIKIVSFVSCAGMMNMLPLRNVSAEKMKEMFSVNVFSPELLVKALSSKKNNADNLKSVVFISSNISMRGAKAFSLYGASKAAIDGVMRNLAMELAPKIRLNSVLPGGMKTEMTKEIYENPETAAAFDKSYPLGIGEPRDICPLVRFLISDESRWITGQQFVVDGGRTIDITER